MVEAELLCIVMATSGNKSFAVLNFIIFLLFSKNAASATDRGGIKDDRHFAHLQVMKLR